MKQRGREQKGGGQVGAEGKYQPHLCEPPLPPLPHTESLGEARYL